MGTITINNDWLVDWPIRLVNIVLDILSIYLVIAILMICALSGNDDLALWLSTLTDTGYNLIGAAAMCIYYIVLELTTQRSAGKYITGTMVVMEDGSKPTVKAIVIRTLCRFLPFEVFSFLGSYPRGWHDNSSGTYVVSAKKYKQALALKDSFEEIGIAQEY